METPQRPYRWAVLIMRAQIFHNGHLELLGRSFSLADKVLLLLGSTNQSRSVKNPFNFHERKAMIGNALSDFDAETNSNFSDRFIVQGVEDDLYNDNVWLSSVQTIVSSYVQDDDEIALVGHKRDHSSYYLECFPQWDFRELGAFHENVSATLCRDLYYRGKLGELGALVPKAVLAFLEGFRCMEEYTRLVEEDRFLKDYRRSWEASPYPPVFYTVDAVLVHSGHILLIQRDGHPGKGQWALPGGFIGKRETGIQACIRELREETRLKLPEKVLRGSLHGDQTFDHPDRSQRGRTITRAFYFDIVGGELPKVKGGDDAAHAEWYPLSRLGALSTEMFEDHFSIISYFISSRVTWMKRPL